MILLDITNLRDYLLNLKALPIQITSIGKIEELSDGNNGFVFKAKLKTNQGQKQVVVKQGRPYNKRVWQTGKILPTAPERTAYEAAVFQYLEKLWGTGFVPKVYYVDKKNFAFISEFIGDASQLLSQQLDAKKIEPGLGTILGHLLGKLHAGTRAPRSRPKLPDDGGYLIKALDYYTNRYLFAAQKEGLGKAARSLYTASRQTNKSLCWVDPVTRNIFTKKGKPILFDFEDFQLFDPAWDLGLLLSSWTIIALDSNKKITGRAMLFFKNFLHAYKKEFRAKNQENLQMILARSLGYQGIYLLSRVSGQSGSYYSKNLALEKKIRAAGKNFLNKKYTNKTAWHVASLFLGKNLF